MAAKETFIFAADDFGLVFVDGRKIAETSKFYDTAQFSTNQWYQVLAVEVYNTPAFSLSISSNTGFIIQSSSGIVSDESWKCTLNSPDQTWTTAGFDDRNWLPAVCYAKNDNKFYTSRRPLNSIATSTCWIGTSAFETMNFLRPIYCRKALQR